MQNLVTNKTALVAIAIAVALAAPYKICSGGAIVSAFASAILAIILYKVFNENEDSLTRRLNRIKKLDRRDPNKPVRIWVDGCFDLMHFGHANAFRQARALGDQLVVGVNPDVDIIKYKGGPPIMNDEERVAAVKACRFVDEVVPGAPYVMTEEYLHYIFDKYKIDYVVHGDDVCLTPDGKDVFEAAKKLGRFRTVKRTEGVSTTDLVGRMLLMNRDHHRQLQSQVDIADSSHEAFQRASTFLPTSRRFSQFATHKQPQPGDRVVYVDGTWDMFHAGHIEFLEQCRKQGDFLLVGVHSDDVANQRHGANYPIMNLHERVLSVLSCKHVDDVVFGAPWKVTKDLLVTFNVSVVCHGRVQESRPLPAGMEDPYSLPKEMGILRLVDSPRELKTEQIVERIMKQRADYERKFAKKNASEQQYKQDKVYVQEL